MDDVIYKSGDNINDVKKKIIVTLSPYFVNQEEVERNLKSSSLLSVYEFIVKYKQDEQFVKGIKEVLTYYRKALSINKEETINILFEKADDFLDSENKMWNVRKDKPEFDKELYDSVMEGLRYIGSSLEISVKSIVSELYALCLVIDKQKINYQEIWGSNFGYNVNRLLEEGYFQSILETTPLNLKLSDWRNISMHFSYAIENETIVLYYGKNNKNSVEIDYEIFKESVYQIIRSANILNIARCIFVYDNMESLKKYMGKRKLRNRFRDDMLFEQLKISFLSEGFELKNIFRDKSGLKVELKELERDMCDDIYITQREEAIAQIFGGRANGIFADKIHIKYYSKKDIIMDIFFISI